MILPAETDDALAALRAARDALGAALDELAVQETPTELTIRFEYAHNVCAGLVDQLTAAIDRPAARQAHTRYMEAVEERHVECQTFPWAELDP